MSYRYDGQRPPLSEYEKNATGKLTLELVSGHGAGRPAKFGDRKSWTLEDKLPELLAEVELRAIEEQQRKRAAEREEAERRKAWEAAKARALEQHIEKCRAEALKGEVAKWRRASQIRAYCDAAESAYGHGEQAARWIEWARRYADSIDPLRTAPRPPEDPDPEDVSMDDLRPYMGGWNPYEPTGRGWWR